MPHFFLTSVADQLVPHLFLADGIIIDNHGSKTLHLEESDRLLENSSAEDITKARALWNAAVSLDILVRVTNVYKFQAKGCQQPIKH